MINGLLVDTNPSLKLFFEPETFFSEKNIPERKIFNGNLWVKVTLHDFIKKSSLSLSEAERTLNNLKARDL
jgi:hypothetical protein